MVSRETDTVHTEMCTADDESHTGVDGSKTAAGALMTRLDRPNAAESTTFAVIADPHVGVRSEGTSKIFERTETHFQAAIDDIAARDVDAVLSVGDLTRDGEPWNYEAVDAVIADLDVPFFAVPGNHDVPKDSDEHQNISADEFADRYAPDTYPFVERVGGVDVVGLNTSGDERWLTDTHEGALDDDQLSWLADTLPDLDDPLVLMHHNLPAVCRELRDHREVINPEMVEIPELRDGETVVEALSDGDVPLVLTGHLHIPSTGLTDGVREIMVPTTCSFPQAYLRCEVGPDGTEVRFVPIAAHEGLRDAYHRRATDSVTAQELTAMASIRLAQFPLVEEW